MDQSVWSPYFVAASFYFALIWTIWTLPLVALSEENGSASEISSNGSEALATDSSLEEASLTYNHVNEGYKTKQPWEKFAKLVWERNILILIFCTAAKRFGFLSSAYSPQYASERFHLAFSQTPWFSLAISSGSMFSQGILLPTLTTWLNRLKFRNKQRELFLVRLNFFALSCGYLILWLAPGPITFGAAIFLCGLGEGVEPGIRSLASYFVTFSEHTRLFFTLTLVELICSVLGNPIMVFLLSIGRRHDDGTPTGLLFLFSSAIFLAPILILYFLRLNSKRKIVADPSEADPLLTVEGE